MRLAVLLAAATLASCGEPDAGDRSETANKVVAAQEAAVNAAMPPALDVPANVAAAAPLATVAIPAPFQGVYDESEEACARPSEYRLSISDKALRFHESIGTAATVIMKNARSVSVLADYEGEGEKWRSRRQLDLSEDGRTLIVSGEGTRLTRVRCL